MIIRIDEEPYSGLKFFKGEVELNGSKRIFEICLDTNIIEKRKKINFLSNIAQFSEIEKTEILMTFNEMLGRKIEINTIEE